MDYDDSDGNGRLVFSILCVYTIMKGLFLVLFLFQLGCAEMTALTVGTVGNIAGDLIVPLIEDKKTLPCTPLTNK